MGYHNISFYKARRSSLLKLMYPDEWSSVGKVVFKNSIYKGITVRLWQDEISISFNETIIESHDDLMNKIAKEMVVLSSMCEYKVSKVLIRLVPTGRNDFADTELGMQQRAALYILILDLCLKLIGKHLREIKD
jgi:hypothetical protein